MITVRWLAPNYLYMSQRFTSDHGIRTRETQRIGVWPPYAQKLYNYCEPSSVTLAGLTRALRPTKTRIAEIE